MSVSSAGVVKLWQSRVLTAYVKGYRVDRNGLLLNPRGEQLTARSGKYPMFGVWDGTKAVRIPVHKFAAFCFYGESALAASCVRHRNGNRSDFRRENIAIGTYAENEADKEPSVRRTAATQAAHSTHKFKTAHHIDSRGNKKCVRCSTRKSAELFPVSKNSFDGKHGEPGWFFGVSAW